MKYISNLFPIITTPRVYSLYRQLILL